MAKRAHLPARRHPETSGWFHEGCYLVTTFYQEELKQMRHQDSRIILHRLLEGILFVLLGLSIGLILQSFLIYNPPWDKGATGEEELLPLLQTLGPSCGPTSLAMVAQAWGIPLSEGEAVLLARMTPRGTSMSNLVRAGRAIGLELVGMRLNLDKLIKANKPVIAHIPSFHYVVIEHATDQQVTIIDPASGRRRNVPPAQFAQMWEGNCLVVVEKKPSSLITDWLIAGPYEKEQPLAALLENQKLKWRKTNGVFSKSRYLIDLVELLGRHEEVVAYAKTCVYSPRKQWVQFKTGSDDGIAVWLNGEQLLNNKNLVKKGTIIALALAVFIGMSYFGSQDYLNQSIMDMLMGASGCKKWQDGCGSYLCPEGTACSIYDPCRSPKCHNYTCSVNKPDCDAYGKPAGACKCGNLCTHADGTCRDTGFYHCPQGEHMHTCYDSHTYP